MAKAKLNERQEKVYRYLISGMSNGLPPTVREICKACQIKSTSTVHAILDSLEQNGYIIRDSHSSRAIRIADSVSTARVPLVGRVTAGQPILAVEQIEDYIPYPADNSEGLFALRVVGLSMKDAGILDGDIVVANKNASYKSGDIIIGMDGDEATVKRLIQKDGKIIFMPENPDFDPIYPENPSVIGKVVGCYRKY